ncbi:hypothetical protein [Zestomonas carbonaria]|uniref:Uncharacterized protein n=1 Tax=Zestomonas carbonaria TaxID=2762745 RepID=A0A7U7IBZ2_9GAMM|nr:hypothetical protein [Pseudomonas carbonaria]CAD5109557.1 hypothetical protein PSEWESI4_03862 [Pseudomonas carbonaria]
MKANRSDAPSRLHKKKKSHLPALIAFGITGAAVYTIIWPLLKPVSINVNQFKQAFETEQPSYQYQAAANPTYAAPQPRAEITWSNGQGHQTQTRQTTYNDQNYTPRTDINTVQPPPARHYASNSSSQRSQTIRRTHSSYWEWESGHQKKRVAGHFEWVEIDGKVDHSSVCQNYKYGSLIYRDCRKGAKVALKKMCGKHEGACYAGNHLIP